jgi:hypothetical protein
LTDSGDIYSLAVSGKNLFAGTVEAVYLTTNNGTSWTGEGLNSGGCYALTLTGTELFAGTYGDGNTNAIGVWRRPLSQMINPSAVAATPPAQNSITAYPNPLTQSTTITFSSPESGTAEVTIVNLLGTEVKRIFSGEIEAGEHSFGWDAISEPPGMYECIVRVNGNSQQIPIILTK